MRSKLLNIIILNFGLLALAYMLSSNASNPPDGFTGAPGQSTCGNCHSGGSFDGNPEITGLPSTINAGQAYNITVTLNNPSMNASKGGFQLVALTSTNANAGDLTALMSDHGTSFLGGKEYVDHRGAKIFSGGSVSWTFQWTAPNGPNGQQITLYACGNYCNGNNSSSGDQAKITNVSGTLVSTATPPTVTVSSTNLSCFGVNNGTASAVAADGTPPYTYLWSNNQTNANISNLAPGTYKVTVTDAASLTATGQTTITQPTVVAVNLTSVSLTCANPQGTINSTVTGGVPPYTYSWNTGETTANLTVTSGGQYTVTVTDDNGCTKSKSVTVSSNMTPPNLFLNNPVITCSNPTPQAIATVTGGKTPYSYLWSDGQTTSTVTITANGPFSITVTDANGCTATKEVVLSIDVAAPAVSIDDPAMITCSKKTVQLNATSSPAGNYNWTTTNGHIVSGKTTLKPIVDKPGLYTLTVINPSNGCSTTSSVIVEGVQPVNAIQSHTNINCFGDSTSIAVISATGGQAPYSFTWSTGDKTATVDSLPAGNYSVIVKDSGTCSDTVSFTITQPTKLGAVINSTDQTGPGKNDGTATLIPSGGSPPYSVLWNTSDTTLSIDSLAVGNYSVTLTDSLGCSTSQSTFINPFNCGININSTISKSIDCFGGSGSVCVDVNGGTLPYNYLWSNGVTTNCLNNVPADIYNVTVTDAVGCKFIKQVELTQPSQINILPADITIIPETGNGNNNAFINVNPSGGTPPYNITFDKGSNGSLPAGLNIVTVTDSKGCVREFSINVPVYPCDSLGVKSATISFDNLCFGEAVIACISNIQGGVGPYNYTWPDNSTSNCWIAMLNGQVNVIVTDSKNCSTELTANYTVPTEINISSVIMDSDGTGNGSVNIQVNGGLPPYSYNWDNGFTTKDINGLKPGDYCVTITDDNNCTKVACYTVKLEVSTKDISEAGWSLFPNPANDVINLKRSNAVNTKLSWTIIDNKGGIILESKDQNNKGSITIPIEELRSGYYILLLKENKKSFSAKFLKK